MPKSVLNKTKANLEICYNKLYDIIIISKDGTLGQIIEVQNLKIGLPLQPKKVFSRSSSNKKQYWEPFEYPKELRHIKTIFQWNEYPSAFKEMDFIY